VMVNFYPPFVSEARRQWLAARAAEKARLEALNLGNPKAGEAGLEAWVAANPAPAGAIADVASHLDHIKRRAGAAHVGLGGDFDGCSWSWRGGAMSRPISRRSPAATCYGCSRARKPTQQRIAKTRRSRTRRRSDLWADPPQDILCAILFHHFS